MSPPCFARTAVGGCCHSNDFTSQATSFMHHSFTVISLMKTHLARFFSTGFQSILVQLMRGSLVSSLKDTVRVVFLVFCKRHVACDTEASVLQVPFLLIAERPPCQLGSRQVL